jgi:hypothetical protein
MTLIWNEKINELFQKIKNFCMIYLQFLQHQGHIATWYTAVNVRVSSSLVRDTGKIEFCFQINHLLRSAEWRLVYRNLLRVWLHATWSDPDGRRRWRSTVSCVVLLWWVNGTEIPHKWGLFLVDVAEELTGVNTKLFHCNQKWTLLSICNMSMISSVLPYSLTVRKIFLEYPGLVPFSVISFYFLRILVKFHPDCERLPVRACAS